MATVLKLNHPNRPRACRGHPWVFTNELREPPPAADDGTGVELRDAGGRLLGMGIVNHRSQIAWRRYARERVAFDAAHVRAALERAVQARAAESCRRLVWSEADALPGLVVDQFEGLLVAQAMTLAVDRLRPEIGEALHALHRPEDIVWRNDSNLRRLEGLPPDVGTRSGRPVEPRWVSLGGIDQWLDPASGQKTGIYLDQRHEHAALAPLCAGKQVLDGCCHQGGFALHAARAGAAGVEGIDSSEEAVAAARRAAERNRLAAAQFVAANLFDWFTALAPERRWDVIVLDPPPFARSQKALEGAVRGYKELNLRALQHLAPGGLLATYTCSHHVTAELLLDMVGDAAHDARRRVRVESFRHQPADHPVQPGFPESEYLRGLWVRAE